MFYYYLVGFLLREGWEAASYLYITDEENKVYTVASRWLNISRTRFETFGERLSLDDFVVEDKTTRAGAGSSRATNESRSSSRRRRNR